MIKSKEKEAETRGEDHSNHQEKIYLSFSGPAYLKKLADGMQRLKLM